MPGAKTSNHATIQEHFVDKTVARTSHENQPLRPSDLNTYNTEAQREMRPLQARENDPNAIKQAQAMESRRKLMEELLTLKQEVTQLRRAAELNESGEPSSKPMNKDASNANSAILSKFKEQIQSLRVSQDDLQAKYDEQERKTGELSKRNEHMQVQFGEQTTLNNRLKDEVT